MNKPKVKVVTVIQVGNRRYVNPKLAADEYVGFATERLFRKHREQWALKNGGDRYGLWHVLQERMHRRVLPIFQRVLSEAEY